MLKIFWIFLTSVRMGSRSGRGYGRTVNKECRLSVGVNHKKLDRLRLIQAVGSGGCFLS